MRRCASRSPKTTTHACASISTGAAGMAVMVRATAKVYGQGYRRGYPGDDFGGDRGDYDGDGGYGGFGGDDGYGGGSRRHRYERAKAACAIWIAQMQASGCFN